MTASPAPWQQLSDARRATLFGHLAAVEAAGQAGIALCAPLALADSCPALVHTASGALTQAERQKLDALALFDYLEPVGEETVRFRKSPTAKRESEATLRLYRLGEQGRAALDRRLQDRLQTVEGLREALAEYTATLAGVRDTLALLTATGAAMARAVEHLADDIVARFGEGLEPAATHPGDASDGPSVDGGAAGSSPDRLAAAILAILPDGPGSQALPIPDLHRKLAEAGHTPGPGALADALLALSRGGQVDLPPWTGSLHEVPEPEFAIFRPGARVAWYVRRR